MKGNRFCILAAWVLLISSCTPKLYLPDRTNVPGLREAGEVKLTSSFRVQSDTKAPHTVISPSFDLAVSPITGWGLLASYRSTTTYGDGGSSDSVRYHGERFEFGTGYYVSFGGKGLFDLYVGGGWGNTTRLNYTFPLESYQARYYQFFLQPSIGFHHKEVLDFSGGIKFMFHKFSLFSSPAPAPYSYTDPESNIADPIYLIVGPFLNFEAGYQYVKFNMQVGANVCASKPRIKIAEPLYFSLGLTLGLAPRYWLKQKVQQTSRSRQI